MTDAQQPAVPLGSQSPPPSPGIVPPPSRQRRSIFSGLLLIVLGILFLLFRFDPQIGLGLLIWRFWPVIIIVWGLAKLVDHLAARQSGERTTVLSGGEAAVLIVAVFSLAGLGFADWLRKHHDFEFNFHPFSERYSVTDELPGRKIPAGAHILIATGRGNISVHTGGGDELRVTVNKSAADANEGAAQRRMANVRTVIEQTPDGFSVRPENQNDWEGEVEADMDIEVPKGVSVTANSAHGDLAVAGLSGAIDVNTGQGNIDVHDAGSDVSASLSGGNLRLSNVSGNLRVTGHGSEIEVSDVKGDASFDGEFFGPVRVRNVARTTRYASQRSDLTLTQLTGRLELGTEGLQVSDVEGPARLNTHNKDMDVENVSGPLEITDSHGDITVRCSHPPNSPISISDESGEVNLTLPGNSSFEISAISRSGQVDSEFEDPSLELVNDESTGRLSGKFGSHGPKITIVTSYGAISLHKGT
ncbi:MAG TPA: DUF4097 family beta strand repeat-containing protein [Candidatus Cybelea sp.]|nr:DUF4097 family beta strand repeat-containing protein [Candidatus Cybelea sp.]